MSLKQFPIQKLDFSDSEIYFCNNDIFKKIEILIKLEPFQLNLGYEVEEVDQVLEIDFDIEENETINDFENKVMEFPVNPDYGYVECSIYIGNVHNPIDITKIEFGKRIENKIAVKIYSHWLFEHEKTGFKNEKIIIETILKIEDYF